jgi:hypothetical protein
MEHKQRYSRVSSRPSVLSFHSREVVRLGWACFTHAGRPSYCGLTGPVNAVRAAGQTPLMYACFSDCPDLIKLLLTKVRAPSAGCVALSGVAHPGGCWDLHTSRVVGPVSDGSHGRDRYICCGQAVRDASGLERVYVQAGGRWCWTAGLSR